MSIIADALERLQTDTVQEPGKSQDQLAHSKIPNPEGVGRQQTKPSHLRLWPVGIGVTLGLLGIGLGMYWVGLSSNFGMPTNAFSKTLQHMLLLTASSQGEPSVLHSQSSKMENVVTSKPQQDILTVDSTLTRDTLPINQDIVTVEALHFKDRERRTFLPSKVDSLVSFDSLASANSSTSQPFSQKNRDLITTNPRDEVDEAPIEGKPQTQTVSVKPSAPSIAEPINQISPHPTSKAQVLGKDSTLKKVPLEEEVVQGEKYANIDTPSSDDRHVQQSTVHPTSHDQPLEQNDQAGSLKPSPNHRFKSAQQLVKSGKYKEAASLLSPLFKDPPVNWKPWFWMGTALLGQGQFDKADQFFLGGLARNDKIPQLWIQRALVAQQRGDFQLAIHELRQAESLETDLPHIHLNMGYAYEKLGNDRLANQYYGKFLKFSEGNPDFFSTRKKLFARLTQQSTPVDKRARFTPSSTNP